MNFKEYLEKKKIDPAKFSEAEPNIYSKLKEYFEQVHPESFTMQKKFLVNDLRRKYHYEGIATSEQDQKPVPPKKTGVSKSGVKIKPKFKKP